MLICDASPPHALAAEPAAALRRAPSPTCFSPPGCGRSPPGPSLPGGGGVGRRRRARRGPAGGSAAGAAGLRRIGIALSLLFAVRACLIRFCCFSMLYCCAGAVRGGNKVQVKVSESIPILPPHSICGAAVKGGYCQQPLPELPLRLFSVGRYCLPDGKCSGAGCSRSANATYNFDCGPPSAENPWSWGAFMRSFVHVAPADAVAFIEQGQSLSKAKTTAASGGAGK